MSIGSESTMQNLVYLGLITPYSQSQCSRLFRAIILFCFEKSR